MARVKKSTVYKSLLHLTCGTLKLARIKRSTYRSTAVVMAVTVTENFVRKRVVLLNPLIIVDSVRSIDAGQAYSTSLVVSNIDGPTPDTVGK